MTRVRVYKNLHTGTLSMQTYIRGRGWRVTAHPERVELFQARFIVYEAGRQRVLREKRKNVHAYIEGFIGCEASKVYDGRARYNPYEGPSWTANGDPIGEATRVLVCSRQGVFYDR